VIPVEVDEVGGEARYDKMRHLRLMERAQRLVEVHLQLPPVHQFQETLLSPAVPTLSGAVDLASVYTWWMRLPAWSLPATLPVPPSLPPLHGDTAAAYELFRNSTGTSLGLREATLNTADEDSPSARAKQLLERFQRRREALNKRRKDVKTLRHVLDNADHLLPQLQQGMAEVFAKVGLFPEEAAPVLRYGSPEWKIVCDRRTACKESTA
ncbi:unnamed protein product, partial [Symbiodinium sp. KB8]